MIKPILKIELPEGTEREHLEAITENLKNSTAAAEYHIIILTGKSDYVSIDIITASDASIHKP